MHSTLETCNLKTDRCHQGFYKRKCRPYYSIFHSFLWKRKENIYIEREKKEWQRKWLFLCSETKVTFHILSAFCVWGNASWLWVANINFPNMVSLKNTMSCFEIYSSQYMHTPNREYISFTHTSCFITFLEHIEFSYYPYCKSDV